MAGYNITKLELGLLVYKIGYLWDAVFIQFKSLSDIIRMYLYENSKENELFLSGETDIS